MSGATILAVISTIVVLAMVVFALGATLLMWKLHKTIRQYGSFRCRYRPDIHSGWTEGVAVYGSETLQWYRLVSLSQKPLRTWSRRSLVISAANPVGSDQKGRVFDLRVHADGHKFFLEMGEADYNGMVAWSEAGPPRSASFL